MGLDIINDPATGRIDYKIVLIYIPDIAIEYDEDSKIFKFFFDNLSVDNPKVFVSGNLTQPVNYNDASVQGYLRNYQTSGIRVYPYGIPGTGTRPLNLCTAAICQNDSTFDANGMVFPFQEIKDFFKSSQSDTLMIVNVAEHDEQHGFNFYKHGIAFTDHTVGTFPNEAMSANLGALCPPRCKEVTLRYVKHQGFWYYIFNPSFYGKDYKYFGVALLGFGALLGLMGFLLYRKFAGIGKK